MNRILFTILLSYFIYGGAFAQKSTDERLQVMKSEREDYYSEVKHFIIDTYYGMLQEAVSSTEVHKDFISYLMAEDGVKYMPEFTSDAEAMRYQSPIQYFSWLYRVFTKYTPAGLKFSVSNMHVFNDFFRYGLRGCYVCAEYDLEIGHHGKVLSNKRCRMYCLFPNRESRKLIKVLQVEPITDLLVKNSVVSQKSSDKAETFDALLVRAKQGDSDAQFKLGKKYYEGKDIVRDFAEAVKWYRKAAEQEHAGAQFGLGFCYEFGDGVPRNYQETIKWYKRAADQGYASAQAGLGFCYENGKGVPESKKKAVRWYCKAAEYGHEGAQLALGDCYQNGIGVSKNDKEAVRWYLKAAEQGNHVAQFSLGDCYENGKGVRKDENKAAEWYRKAAEQGNWAAMLKLGYKNINVK